MKHSKIAILFALVGIAIISFLLLLIFFRVPMCELFKNTLTSIMISSIVAIPSVIFLLYNSSNSTNQNISELYIKLFVIVRDEVSKISELNNKEANELKDKLVTISKNIGKLKEATIVDNKYNSDILTNHISELIKLIRNYIKAKKQNQSYVKPINIKCQKIIEYICEIEGIPKK